MSYCRWGPRSDVYVYEHVGGWWQIHVGKQRQISSQSLPVFQITDGATSEETYAAIVEWIHKDQEWRAGATWETIELEEAGKDFEVKTPAECADILEDLKKKGFRVPDYAIETLREEALDVNSPGT